MKISLLRYPPTWIRFLRWGYPYMVLWGIFVHLNWGINLLLDERVGKLTIFVGLQQLQEVGIGNFELSITLILVSALALLALMNEENFRPRHTLILLMPQYFLLLIAFFSDIQFIVAAKNPNTGMHVSPVLLETILWPVMIAAVLHTLSIIERFVVGPRRDS